MGPVNSTSRAMMASLQQAMTKGMPVDQAIAYVKSMAQQGVAPLVDLYAMLNQFQRLKQPQVQAPQTPPTIKDQVNMAAMQRSAMEQGLGGLNAGSMETPQFAGGGIVAFQEGGETSLAQRRAILARQLQQAITSGAPPEEIQRIKSELARESFITSAGGITAPGAISQRIQQLGVAPKMEAPVVAAEEPDFSRQIEAGLAPVARDVSGFDRSREAPARPSAPAPARRVAAAPAARAPADAPAAPAKSGIEGRYEELAGLQEKLGIGKAGREYSEYLSSEEKNLAKQFGKDRSLALAEMGFKIAAAASRPGATLMGAMAEGMISGTDALKSLNREMRESQRNMREAQFKLAAADEARKSGNIQLAVELESQAKKMAAEERRHQQTISVDYARIAATKEATEAQRQSTEFSQRELATLRRNQARGEVMDNLGYSNTYMAYQAEKDSKKKAELRSQLQQISAEADKILGMESSDVAAASDALRRTSNADILGQLGISPTR